MNSGLYRRSVVITGMGVIAPNGQDLGAFWHSVRNGLSAAGPVTKFSTAKLPNKIAAEVKRFDSRHYMDSKMARRCDLSTQYALAAATLAVRDAAIDFQAMDPDRIGVVEGTTVSSMESVLKGYQNYVDNDGFRLLSPLTVVNGYCGEGSRRLALHLHQGHAITYCPDGFRQ